MNVLGTHKSHSSHWSLQMAKWIEAKVACQSKLYLQPGIFSDRTLQRWCRFPLSSTNRNLVAVCSSRKTMKSNTPDNFDYVERVICHIQPKKSGARHTRWVSMCVIMLTQHRDRQLITVSAIHERAWWFGFFNVDTFIAAPSTLRIGCAFAARIFFFAVVLAFKTGRSLEGIISQANDKRKQ